jgi:hypothetical protein
MNNEFDLDKELRELDKNIDEHLLNLEKPDFMHSATYIVLYDIEKYNHLIVKLNQIRYSATTYQEKAALICKYKRVYIAKRRKFLRILKNLKEGSLNIRYNKELNEDIDYISSMIQVSYTYNDNLPVLSNVNSFMEAKLLSRIYEMNNEIYKLNKFPYEYINTESVFIAPYNPTKYDHDIIFYKDVFVCNKENHHFGLFYNENTRDETKRAILNILAFLNAEPYFYFSANPNFNRKLDELYRQFDLMDMIRLRKKNYFDSSIEEPFHIESPILKTKKGFNFIEIKPAQHEMIFELYHASLKQFESLPRCVFLYRAFEYGNNFYYNQKYNPNVADPEAVLNHLYSLAMNHNFMPLYYVDFGSYFSENNKSIIKKRKAAYRNFILALKSEADKIVQEWSNHTFLQNKSIGEIIYRTGRNATAHGGSGQHNARYDYNNNYCHINDVNIVLELIVRYLIEKMNPHIVELVERRKKFYIKYHGYEQIFEQK